MIYDVISSGGGRVRAYKSLWQAIKLCLENIGDPFFMLQGYNYRFM